MPERLAVVRRRKLTPRTASTRPLRQREMDRQVLDLEQRGGRVGLLGQRPLAPAADGGTVRSGATPARRDRRPASRRRAVLGPSSASPQLGIEDVVERPADEREGEDDQDDADAGRGDDPPRPEARRAVGLGLRRAAGPTTAGTDRRGR